MRLFIFFIFLFYSSLIKAEDIYSFELEGFSIGDSLLNFISEEEIIKEIELNKPVYNYLNNDFGEVYIFKNLDTYQRISFFVKQKDENYLIYAIYGTISFNNKLNECLSKQKEIESEFSLIFNNAKKDKYSEKFAWDPTGESISHNIELILNSGDGISINCAKYKKSLKIENNWEDSLQVGLIHKEVFDWFRSPIR